MRVLESSDRLMVLMQKTRRFVCMFVLCVLSVTYAVAEGKEKETILFVNSATFNELWTLGFYNIVSQHFDRQGYHTEVVELMVPTVRSLEMVAQKQQMLLEKNPKKPGLVVFIGDPAWVLCRPLFDSVWRDVPVVVAYARDSVPATVENLLYDNLITGTKDLVSAADLQRKYNYTIVQYPFNVEGTVRMMQELMPGMKRVAFIYDRRYISLVAAHEVGQVMKSHFPELDFIPLRSPDLSTEALLDSMAQFDRSVGFIYYSWFIATQSQNRSYLDDKLPKIISSFSKTPIFVLTDRLDLQTDFAGGYYVPLDNYCQTVIDVLEAILQGESANQIPIREGGTPKMCLNYQHLLNHEVDPALYPDQAEYVNYPPSFWEQYKWHFVFGLIALLIVAVFVAMRVRFFVQRQRQREREIKLLTQYRRMVDVMPIVYIQQQWLSSTNFVFKDVNPAFEELFGCRYQQVIERSLDEMVGRYPQLRALREIHNNHKIFAIVDAQKRERYYDTVSFSIGDKGVVEVFCVDRTEEYRVTQALEKHSRHIEELNDKYRLVIRATELIIWAYDLQVGQMEYEMQQKENGHDAYLQGSKILRSMASMADYIHPEDAMLVNQAFGALISGEKDSLSIEYRTLCVDKVDEYVWVSSSAIVGERDSEGRVLKIVGATLDIEQRRRLEQDLRRAKEQAEESNRLKSAFIANMSHEIRTPLNAIVGFSEMVASAETEQERQEFIKQVSVNNKLLLQLVNDVLDLSKLESGMLELDNEPVNLYDLFEEREQKLRAYKDPNHSAEIVFDRESGYCLAYVDSTRLVQVMSNLMSNALKFTDHGTIHYGYRISDDGLWIECFVADTGLGIPADKLNDIFGRFVKLNDFVQGAGLGLPVCQQIVLKMGGRIWVESQEGVGSTFRFTIPYHKAEE